MSWKQTTAAKREQVLSLFPPEWRLASEETGGRNKRPKVIDLVSKHVSATEREITEISVLQLVQKLQHGDVTAREVLVRVTSKGFLKVSRALRS